MIITFLLDKDYCWNCVNIASLTWYAPFYQTKIFSSNPTDIEDAIQFIFIRKI